MERGYGALQVMENHLKTHEFFAAGQLTVADIALYGYTHVADQCDFDPRRVPGDRRMAAAGPADPGLPSPWTGVPISKSPTSASIAASA